MGQLGVIVPLMDVRMKSRTQNLSSSGPGDLRIFAKYLLVQRDRLQETFRIAAKAGIKLPTGDENRSPALGSGSTDYFFSTVAGWIKKRTGLYLEGIYQLNASSGQVNYGDGFTVNLALGYRLLPRVYETYPSPQLNGFLEFSGSLSGRDRIAGVENPNSGGTLLLISPGLQFIGGRRWLVEASFQLPIVNEPNGTQLAVDRQFLLGARILLF